MWVGSDRLTTYSMPRVMFNIWRVGNPAERWLCSRLHVWGPRRLYLLNFLLPLCAERNRDELAGLIGEARALRSWKP